MRWQLVLGLAQDFFQRPKQEGKRRAEFVAHVAEECRLCPVNFRQRLGALPLRLVSASRAQAGSNLSGEQREKTVVRRIERTIRIEAGNEKTGWRLLALLRDGDQ